MSTTVDRIKRSKHFQSLCQTQNITLSKDGIVVFSNLYAQNYKEAERKYGKFIQKKRLSTILKKFQKMIISSDQKNDNTLNEEQHITLHKASVSVAKAKRLKIATFLKRQEALFDSEFSFCERTISLRSRCVQVYKNKCDMSIHFLSVAVAKSNQMTKQMYLNHLRQLFENA